MSRSGYNEEISDMWLMELYRNAVKRALRGKRGQSFLRELASSLDALPEKELIEGELIDAHGKCCAIGAVCISRKMDVSKVDYGDADSVGRFMGIARSMAAEIEYMNDEWCSHETPEQRWKRMRQWVEDSLKEPLP